LKYLFLCSLLNRQLDLELISSVNEGIQTDASAWSPRGPGWMAFRALKKRFPCQVERDGARSSFRATSVKRRYKKLVSSTESSTCLLSDVEIPDRTGIEQAIQLNQERPDTKILPISGLTTRMLVLDNGRQFLPKPFMSDMLSDRIRDFLSDQPPIKEHMATGAI